jgi:hypothetical protein
MHLFVFNNNNNNNNTIIAKSINMMRLRFLLVLVLLGCINARISSASNYGEKGNSANKPPRSVKVTTASAASDEYYDDDDEDYANQAQSSNDEETDAAGEKSPNPIVYKCPSYCKCTFNKQRPHRTTSGKNLVNSDYYDETSSNHYEYKHKARKHKRLVVTPKSKNDTEYDYEEEEAASGGGSSIDTSVNKQKFDITVDCSRQSLTSISNIFDYDFPLDQIVNL